MRREPGRVTISTVAQRVGRSISTVSAALNDGPGVAHATRQEILDAARELGYEADPRARSLRRRHTGLIGARFATGQAFQGQVVDGLYQACRMAGYSLVLSAATPERDGADGLRALLAERCEGLVLVDAAPDAPTLRSAASGVPMALICHDTDLPGLDVVRSRDDVGITALVDHLVMTGRREIVHVDGATASATEVRTRAFLRAMAGHGLAGRARVVTGGADEAAGARAAGRLLDGPALPEALLCFNDHAAVGALMELRRCGVRVPQDLAVTGYDGIPVASAFDLTTVEQDARALAEVAVQALVARIGLSTGGAGGTRGDEPGAGNDGPALPAGVVKERRAAGGWSYEVMPRLHERGTTAPSVRGVRGPASVVPCR